jgi:hypothetical protein
LDLESIFADRPATPAADSRQPQEYAATPEADASAFGPSDAPDDHGDALQPRGERLGDAPAADVTGGMADALDFDDLPPADPVAELAADLRRRHPAPATPALARAPAADWPTDLAEWALGLTPEVMPSVPFTLRPGHTIVDRARFLARLQADLRRGPSGPRARYGALQGDLRGLRRVVD